MLHIDTEETSIDLPRLQALGGAALALTHKSGGFSASLSFVPPEEIRRLNREFRKIDRETDVLSFPMLNLTPADALKPLNADGSHAQCTMYNAQLEGTGNREQGTGIGCSVESRRRQHEKDKSAEKFPSGGGGRRVNKQSGGLFVAKAACGLRPQAGGRGADGWLSNEDRNRNCELCNVNCALKLDLERDENGDVFLGDIVLCPAVLRRQAEEYGQTEARETEYLFIHALLHLLGFDHTDDADAREMRRIEKKIMNED